MEKRCYGCMRPKGTGKFCGYCGYPAQGQNGNRALPVGTVLRGRYLVGKELDFGHSSIRYLGWDLKRSARVAIRECFWFTNNHRTSGSVVAAFDDSRFQLGKDGCLELARNLERLRGVEDVVQFYELFSENNTLYIVMEYVDGIPLMEYVRRRGGKLSAEETFRLMRPVIWTMIQVHDQGVIHRDLNPENIFIQPDGRRRILGFSTPQERKLENTDMNSYERWPEYYVAKDALMTRSKPDQRIDQYSLCAIIYYCLTGEHPPVFLNRMADGVQIKWDEIPALTSAQRRALKKGTACEKKARFGNLRALENALFENRRYGRIDLLGKIW